MSTKKTPVESFFSDKDPFRDLLTLAHLAPARWVASSPALPWVLRKYAARLHMIRADRQFRKARYVAVDHSRWCSAAKLGHGLSPIWQYWAQGVDAAPPLVQACLRSVQRHRGERDLIVLDDRTVENHIELPGHIWDKRALMGTTHFSNFIRLSLLHRHGGTWLDATILLRQPIPDEVEREDFYILREITAHPRLVETWFIHARKGHPLIETVLHGLTDYWNKYDRLHEYFMFPYHFEAALLLHRQLREGFLQMPQIGANRPHDLWKQLIKPFDEAAHRAVFDAFWLHKLTYKYDRPAVDTRLLCDAIIEGWPEASSAMQGTMNLSSRPETDPAGAAWCGPGKEQP